MLRSGLLLTLLAASGCAWMGTSSPLRRWEESAVFRGQRYPAGDWQPTAVLVQDAFFNAADGVKLHGWYVHNPQPKAHALVLHGNSGNVTVLAESLRELNRRHGLSVLAIDYRGFGKSEGKTTGEGVLLDARAGRKWLAEKEGVAEPDILLMGVSLGGAVATELAATDGARGLVLSSTFATLPEVAQRNLPFLPMGLLMTLRFDSEQKLKQFAGPVLIAHGDADEVVPYSHAERLHAAATGPKKLVKIVGGKHNDPKPEEYRQVLDQFLAELPPLSQPPQTQSLQPTATTSEAGAKTVQPFRFNLRDDDEPAS